MPRAASMFAALLVFWLGLSGQWDILHDTGHQFLLACGIGSCAFVTLLAVRKGLCDAEGHPVHLARRILLYVPWLIWQIAKSNWDVIKRVWNPRLPISPRIVTVPTKLRTGLATTAYANSITLTPGTVTIAVDKEKESMVIHCLTEEAGQDLLGMGMHDHVKASLDEP